MPSITQPTAPRHVPAGAAEEVLLGVDTHKDVHAAAVITLQAPLRRSVRHAGRHPVGYRLVAWGCCEGCAHRCAPAQHSGRLGTG